MSTLNIVFIPIKKNRLLRQCFFLPKCKNRNADNKKEEWVEKRYASGPCTQSQRLSILFFCDYD